MIQLFPNENQKMNLLKIQLQLGLSRSLHFLHISDTHLSYADHRDTKRKQMLAKQRRKLFGMEKDDISLRCLREAITFVKQHCDLLLHTGDLIDFISVQNLEIVQQELIDIDYFCTAGNHEFSLYVGECRENSAYKRQNKPFVQPAFRNDLLFASRQLHGVNLVAVDNSYYRFTLQQLTALKNEVAKGLPILLMLHIPLHTDSLYQEMLTKHHQECAYLIGTPAKLQLSYPAIRREQQKTTPATEEFIRYVRQEKQIRAILTGHLHFDYNYIGAFSPTATQYVAGANFHSSAIEFELI